MFFIMYAFSGPSRGVCECGKCKCKEKYTGGNCGQTNCTFAAPDCRSGTTDVCNKCTNGKRYFYYAVSLYITMTV